MKKEEAHEIFEALKSFESEGTKNLQGKLEQELIRLMEKAKKAFDAGDWKEALKFYKEAVELEPDKYSRLWYNLGVTYRKVEMYEKALACFDRATEIDPKNGEAWYNKGIMLSKIWESLPFAKRKSYGEGDAIARCFTNAALLAEEAKNRELFDRATKALHKHENE